MYEIYEKDMIMFKFLKKYISYISAVVLCFSIVINSFFTCSYAATSEQLNDSSIYLKQNTSITCTLSAAAMMLRRTAICADYSDWKDITEDSISSIAWVDGVGLRWKFTVNGMSVDHGYFSAANKKNQLINLLKANPQGIVVYNSGSLGQSHAVFVCDYDAEKDIFYAADPANTVSSGRIPLSSTTMAGSSQKEKINYLNAYWYVTSPVVTFSDGEYSAEEIIDSGEYTPDVDVTKFNESMQQIGDYYVVSSNSDVVMRTYPSGNAEVALNVAKGDLLYIECSGNNNFGAKWYKANNGYYIFNTNLTKLSDYSEHISRFTQTAVQMVGTYSAASDTEDRVAVRIDATEGNNIIAYVPNGEKLYVVESGFNAAGAQWFKTENGYFVKASEMNFESSDNQSNFTFPDELIQLSGAYSAQPVEDVHYSGDASLYKVTASALNVRKSPVDGEIIGLLNNGEHIEVLEIVDNWCRIDFEGSFAWISLDYLVAVTVIDNSYASLIVDKSSVLTGETITCEIEQDESFVYKYSVYAANGDVICGTEDYTDQKSYSFTPDTAGEYYFGVEIKSDNKVYSIYSANINVYTKLQLGAVSCELTEPVVGKTVTWKVETVSVSENSAYVYNLYHNGVLIDESQSSVGSYMYEPEAAGEYYITVCLKDSYSSSEILTSEKIQIYINNPEQNLVLGDLNFDGNVTASDARTALRYATSLEELSEQAILAADVTKDGIVTPSDARLILRFAAKLDSSF